MNKAQYDREVKRITHNYDIALISQSEYVEQLQLLDERYDDQRRRRENIG